MGLRTACEQVRREVATTDPATLNGHDCAMAVEFLAMTEKQMAALRVMLAARAAACGAHKERGFSNPATWLAQTTGITTGEAKSALNTVERLKDCDATREALLAGELSLAQAGEIAKSEEVSPGSEAALLDLAGRGDLSAVKHEARRRRLAAEDPEVLHRRQRCERRGRTWVDEGGMTGLWGVFAPEVGVRVRRRVEAELDGLVRQARRDGSDATVEQLTADAIANLILNPATGAQRRRGGAELVLVCDIAAFQRGRVEDGEICHLLGGGPVPVSVAREWATMAFIKAVLHDGQRIEWVAHFGRYRPSVLATALGLGPPPLFPGVACVECNRRYGLQWDHADPVANNGPTSYDNLQALCWPCHADKTARDRAAGLLAPRPPQPGGTGKKKTGQTQPEMPTAADAAPVESDRPEPKGPHPAEPAPLANPPPAAA